MSKKPDGGQAFPYITWRTPDGMLMAAETNGMSLRDWFATHAPAPDAQQIEMEMQRDKARNPHNDYHKPPLRGRTEIIASLAYEYADAMLKAREGVE